MSTSPPERAPTRNPSSLKGALAVYARGTYARALALWAAAGLGAVSAVIVSGLGAFSGFHYWLTLHVHYPAFYEHVRASAVEQALYKHKTVRVIDIANVPHLLFDAVLIWALPAVVGVVAALVAGWIVAGGALEAHGWFWDRTITRALDRADHAHGWRPRQGAPHPPGRDDIWDRFTWEARPESGEVVFYVQRWVLTGDRTWGLDASDQEPVVRCDPDDEVALGEARLTAEQEVDARNEKSEDEWLAAREARELEAVRRADAAEQQQQARLAADSINRDVSL